MHAFDLTSPNRIFALATTGQRLDIRYDPQTNSIAFVEESWSADVRGPATSRSLVREQLDTARIRRLPRRRAA